MPVQLLIIHHQFARKEINYALKLHKPFFTIYLRETQLPNELIFDMDEIQAMKKYQFGEFWKLTRIKRKLQLNSIKGSLKWQKKKATTLQELFLKKY